jgi:hypothetical protein
MAMHGRRPRKILQNRVELLTYETVREALLVADQAAQSDEHRQFVIRMSQRVCELSDSGRGPLQGGTNTLRIPRVPNLRDQST